MTLCTCWDAARAAVAAQALLKLCTGCVKWEAAAALLIVGNQPAVAWALCRGSFVYNAFVIVENRSKFSSSSSTQLAVL